ncbi:MAG: ATP-binding protein, partial [Alphaproteobacteria bacterium]|nr:ATP-binding protein [Alphaproteobacteria bacterium]
MKANLSAIVANFKKADALTVLQEAIVNSIQANATQIDIQIKYQDTLKNEGKQIDIWNIEELTITDNGEGFTKENIKSFSEYRTQKKIKSGCKGIGRIAFLKIFKKVKIESFIESEKKQVTIDFNENFEGNGHYIKSESKSSVEKNKTTITFREIKEKKNSFHSLGELKEKIIDHLLPLLYFSQLDW